MTSELQVLGAFRTWRDVARTIHSVDALPTDQELIAAAQDHTELDPGGRFPALLVWASALKRVRAFVMIGNEAAIANPRDESLYQPDLGTSPSQPAAAGHHYAEFEDVVSPTDTEIPVRAPAARAEAWEDEPATVPAAEPTVEPPADTAPAPTPVPEPEPMASEPTEPEPTEPEPSESEPTAPDTAEPDTAASEPADIPVETAPVQGGRRRRARHATDEIDHDLRDFESHEFRRLDPFADAAPLPGAEFRVQPTSTGGLELQWQVPAAAAGVVRLYRVVSDEVEFEQDPEEGEPRAVTVGTRWVDDDEMTTALRMYQVWMHEGTSETAALRGEPQLVGEQFFIRPIENIDLSVAGSVIKGQWAPEKHTHRVAVYAVPATERRTMRRQNEIATSEQNLQGFRFTPTYRGVTYKFVAQRFVRIHGQQVASRPSQEFEVHVPAEIIAVPITVGERSDGFDTRFDVSWEQPSSGEVRIYRTQQAPVDGLEDRVIEENQLESFGLSRRDWANDLRQGENSCQVEWPEDWYSVFITPVSVVGAQARVGRAHSRVRVGEISNARLHERVNNQLVTFGWPQEAHEITAVFGDPGSGHQLRPTAEGPGSNIASIYRQAYEEEGGMRIRLRAAGDIALFPSRVYEGRQIWGTPVILHYDGLRRLHYQLDEHQGRIMLSIFSEWESNGHHHFTLRLQTGRLPLEPEDGAEVRTRKWSGHAPADPAFGPGVNASVLGGRQLPVVEQWELDPAVLTAPANSYLRLFTREQHRPGQPEIALIDPNPALLELDNWIRLLNPGTGATGDGQELE
ncbi:hypothetical protein [Corynebacterium halotolerans]|uniref:hypothetical protein n=1 Tax=Corynebacterium halotolerans TaxID=225326 RepID=UPI003CFB4648